MFWVCVANTSRKYGRAGRWREGHEWGLGWHTRNSWFHMKICQLLYYQIYQIKINFTLIFIYREMFHHHMYNVISQLIWWLIWLINKIVSFNTFIKNKTILINLTHQTQPYFAIGYFWCGESLFTRFEIDCVIYMYFLLCLETKKSKRTIIFEIWKNKLLFQIESFGYFPFFVFALKINIGVTIKKP